jgi:VanZ family protein
MLPLRHYKRWRFAGIVILLAVLAATFTPTRWLLPVLSRSDFLLMDKRLHMLTFVFLSLWFTGQYARRSYWRLAVGLTAFGVLIELGQAFVSYRTAEWQDLVADVFGTAVGLIIANAGTGGWSLRFEQWLEKGTASVD